MAEEKEYYTIPEAAKILKHNQNSRLYSLTKQGRIKSKEIDGHTMVEHDSLMEYRDYVKNRNVHAERKVRAVPKPKKKKAKRTKRTKVHEHVEEEVAS